MVLNRCLKENFKKDFKEDFKKDIKKGFKKKILFVKDEALSLRDCNYRKYPDMFEEIEGTDVVVPTTKNIKSLIPYPVKPGLAPASHKDYEKTLNFVNGEQIIEPTSSEEEERTSLLKVFYQNRYGSGLPLFDEPSAYHTLPEWQRALSICDHLCERIFAATYIFDSDKKFKKVAKKHEGDPIKISSAYNVPFFYTTFQLAAYNINQSHFRSTINGEKWRHLGSNETLFEELPKMDFLVGLLENIKPKYHNMLIYRYKKFGKKYFLCMGMVLRKRGNLRVHVFGLERAFVTEDFLYALKNIGIIFQPSLLN